MPPATAKNWLSYGKDYGNTRYTGSKRINAGNVGTLVPRWVYQTAPIGSFETTPLVVDGSHVHTTAVNHAIALTEDRQAALARTSIRSAAARSSAAPQ